MAATLTGTGVFSFSSPFLSLSAGVEPPLVLVLARATPPEAPCPFDPDCPWAVAAASVFRWMYRPAAEAAATTTRRTIEKTKARLRRETVFINPFPPLIFHFC